VWLSTRWVILRVLGRPPALELALRLLFGALQTAARQAVTQALMTISFPETPRLRLWSDLSGEYPLELRSPFSHPDLCSLLEQVDPTRDSPLHSGAVDWADLPDRLHFIVDLFRMYQQRKDLFEPPFTPDQVSAMREGRIPHGPL
jgi:hypothetical protein